MGWGVKVGVGSGVSVGSGVYVGCGVGSITLSSGRSPVPGGSIVGVGVRMFADTIIGAGVLVGLGSPANMSQARTTGRTRAHAASFQNVSDTLGTMFRLLMSGYQAP